MTQTDWNAAVDLVLAEVQEVESEREAERLLRAAGYSFSDTTLRTWRELRREGKPVAKPRAPNTTQLREFVKQKEAARTKERTKERTEGGFYADVLSESGASSARPAADDLARQLTGVMNRMVWSGKLSPPEAIDMAWAIAREDGYDAANEEYVRRWEAMIRSAMEMPNGGTGARSSQEG